MINYEIDNAVDDLISIFVKSGYTEKTITEHKRNIQKVVDLHHEHEKRLYNSEIVDNYILKLKSDYDAGLISRSRKNALVKAALYVQEISSTGTIMAGAKQYDDKLSTHYRKILEEIKCSDDWSRGLNQNIVTVAHTYFLFLAGSEVSDISRITEETIRCYFLQKASVISPNSINTMRSNLKHLHYWLYKKGYIQSDFSDVLSFTTPCSHHIKKPIPHDEIALIFHAIDRDTAIGKRDYAMFMIAVVTGMRSIDIVELKFSDIDWINGEIRITQKKTGNTLSLPLTIDIGEALKDYILFGRPESDFENIFLTSRPPIQPLGRTTINCAFNQIRRKAGLKRCPFHSLRRTVGTSMVVAGIPVTTVAQLLGHSHISSTKQYISLDSVHLKECALGLDRISQNGGKS